MSEFYQEEKVRFEELLKKLDWTEECLLKEQGTLLQCPIDRGHRFPIGSKHVENCQLKKEGFPSDYLEELATCEQEKQLLHQPGILLSPSTLSNILHRPIPIIINNIPLSVEQTTVFFTPHERSLIAQFVHNEALRLGIVPSTPPCLMENSSISSQTSTASQACDKLAELRNEKRRRMKYVTRSGKKSFYDIARELINREMELIQEKNVEQTQVDKDRIKRKHRSSSKKKHRSHKHHRHSKKHRKSSTPD